MAYIQSSLPATLSVEEVTVEITPPTESSLSITTIETTGAISVPAGARWAQIRNAGFVQDGDDEANATIQGQSWSPGREERWEAFLDQANNELLLLPAITGNGNGSRVFITYAI
jgi:hypothetical protein